MFLSLSLCAPTVFLSQTSVGQSFCFPSLTGTKPVCLIGDAVRARPVVASIIHYFFVKARIQVLQLVICLCPYYVTCTVDTIPSVSCFASTREGTLGVDTVRIIVAVM